MDPRFTYFLILFASVAGPLALSFDKKVGFYRQWKFLFPAMLLPALFYIVWDVIFTALGVWRFNGKYIVGWKIAGLPLEEILFFFLVPYCCVFIYACIRAYFPGLREKKTADRLLQVLAAALLVAAILFRHRAYTGWTFLFNALFIALIYARRKYFRYFDAASFLVAYAVVLVPFLVVNGLLTAIPVVIYNDAENLGLRIYSIPFEDIFYGMLLVLGVVAGFERSLHAKA